MAGSSRRAPSAEPPCAPLPPPHAQSHRLEAVGLSRAQAEGLTRHITQLLCDNKEKLAENFVMRAALEKARGLCACGVCGGVWRRDDLASGARGLAAGPALRLTPPPTHSHAHHAV